MSRGIKLHLGNSDVQLENPKHVQQLRRVFRAANRYRMAIAVHMRASISRKRPYGAAQARVFLEQVLPVAEAASAQGTTAAPMAAHQDGRHVFRILIRAARIGVRPAWN